MYTGCMNHLRRSFLLLALGISPIWSQGAPVTVNPFPANVMPTKVFTYSGNNKIYECTTKPFGPWNNGGVPASFSWTKAATTFTNVVVLTNVGTVTTSTAHGLRIGNKVVISGATVDTDLNATYIVATVPSTTTFTVATVSVADATYTDAGLVLTTAVPRSTAAIWTIQKFTYDGSNNKTGESWALGSPAAVNICDNAATLAFQ